MDGSCKHNVCDRHRWRTIFLRPDDKRQNALCCSHLHSCWSLRRALQELHEEGRPGLGAEVSCCQYHPSDQLCQCTGQWRCPWVRTVLAEIGHTGGGQRHVPHSAPSPASPPAWSPPEPLQLARSRPLHARLLSSLHSSSDHCWSYSSEELMVLDLGAAGLFARKVKPVQSPKSVSLMWPILSMRVSSGLLSQCMKPTLYTVHTSLLM